MKVASFAAVISIFVSATALYAENDPLGTPEMKKLAKGAVELGWKYFDKAEPTTPSKIPPHYTATLINPPAIS
jgi:hypothetical protein